jgi:putative heme-binding domain-containing protein
MHDPDRAVRVNVFKLLAERAGDTSALARSGVTDPDPFVRRAAADVLGRHPTSENVKPLLDLWAATPADDTHLVHVARMALRDQLLEPGVYAELPAIVGSDPAQLDRLANVSLGVPNQESAAFVWRQLQVNPAGGARDRYLHHVTRHIGPATLGDLYAFALGLKGLNPADQANVVRELGRGTQERGAKLPADVVSWAGRLTAELLAAGQEADVRGGIDLAREFNLPVFDELAKAAGAEAKFAGLRSVALDACVANDASRAGSLAAAVLANANEEMKLRQHAAGCLARINNDASRAALVANLQTAPERLSVEIAAALCDSPAGAEGLLTAVAGGKASARLLKEAPIVTRLKARQVVNLDERLAKLTAGLPPQDQRIAQLIGQRRKLVADGQSELARGAAVFEKNCAICHRIGERGAKIGPNLDGVGIRGIDRLLEDILDPNRNVDQAFRTTQIVSTDGRIIAGLALREEGKVLVLADAQGKEVRVPAEEIHQRTVNPLSPMPANVPDLVSEADFVHLIGYLLSQREAPPAGK